MASCMICFASEGDEKRCSRTRDLARWDMDLQSRLSVVITSRAQRSERGFCNSGC